MSIRRWLIPSLCIAAVTGAGMAQNAAPAGAAKQADGAVPLIPRKQIFGNPDRASPRLSPDGKQLSFLAPVNGVLNVWVGPADNPDAAKPVTDDKSRGVRQYFWAFTNQHILYLQDEGGDENWRIYSVDLASGKKTDLTPFDSIPGPDGQPIKMGDKVLRPTAQIESVSHRFPDEILIGLNNRSPQFHDLHRLNIRTGKLTLVEKNDQFAGFTTDEDYKVRYAAKFNAKGELDILKPGAKPGEWVPDETIPAEDASTTSTLGFDKTGNVMYMLDSRGRNTAALFAVDLKTGDKKLIAEDPKADIAGVMTHPTENTIEAASSTYARTTWKFLDKAIEADFQALGKACPGDVNVISRTLDDSRWLVAFLVDDGPVKYYSYDRATKKATFLFTNRKSLEGLPLQPMKPVVIKSRDGLELVSYLTLPAGVKTNAQGRPEKPVPMVLNVHGGPWARDGWGLNGEHQWLANRGYAVLSVNFRGSTGFGKNFLNAGNKEWAGKMHDDLIDAVNWAVAEGIADRNKIAIYGGSYGGYSALVGVTFTPDVFACAVDIVGPSNIVTLLASIPPYWGPLKEMFYTRVGHDKDEDGKKFLESRSPITFVDRIKRPLLIGQGANDPRVKQAESDQIVTAMQKKSIPVTYVLFPDEGHGFARPENRMAFYGVAEAFLAQHLGGRFEPIGEVDFSGSTIQVPAGAEGVPGLKNALGAVGR
jgi:dipeptidyl aminopeptidase/acylaminoacyl peptidase